ncbi:hypothetical protein [Pseudooceanicola sp. LIPI14-2-Ac024]|uniref:hypothetical protein n=1 Tax=Pseudooceanicola sp. LIPI14-2-Ac024 TaxID=3344875 RepID=UPI0035CEE8DA
MFHNTMAPLAQCRALTNTEVPLRVFIAENSEALGNAAHLLAGSHGLRLVRAILDGLDQPGMITRRVRHMLDELRCILFLDYDDPWDNVDITELEPDDPIVLDVCLLAGQLDDALHSAKVSRIREAP